MSSHYTNNFEQIQTPPSGRLVDFSFSLFPFSLRSFLVLSTVITRGNDRRIYWGSVDTVGKAFLGRLPVPSSLNGDRRLLFVLQHRSELSASGAANSHREHAIVARPGPFPVGSRGSLEQHAVQQRKSLLLILTPLSIQFELFLPITMFRVFHVRSRYF